MREDRKQQIQELVDALGWNVTPEDLIEGINLLALHRSGLIGGADCKDQRRGYS